MTTAPIWSSVDDPTADLLTLVATAPNATSDPEWHTFRTAVIAVGTNHGNDVDQNHVRPLIRGQINHKRIGPFYRRACLEGWLRADGWSTSEDHEGRNAGRPMRTYRLTGDER
ncbi:MAG: hypothetical protein JWO15_3866 [Sphingomonadales bacterium]|nr:hypothetical protein [Sphingomonadales bacterium]